MVTAALASLGVLIHSLDMAPSQTWGVIRFVGRDETGDQVDVKVYGRDAFDSQLAAKLWHTLWYRETSKTVSYSRLEAVEHEALMTFTADRAGMRVPDLAAVGSASAELSLISFRGSGASPLPGDSTDDLLVETWAQVRLMHEKSLSHGSLHASSVRVSPDGRPIITDFALGSLAAEEADQGSDVAELLFSTGVQVGEERAVRAALEGLGRERLVDALPYFELPAITPTTRRLTEKPKKLMSLLELEGGRAHRGRDPRASEAASDHSEKRGLGRSPSLGGVDPDSFVHGHRLCRDVGSSTVGQLGPAGPGPDRRSPSVLPSSDVHDVRCPGHPAPMAFASTTDREPIHQPGDT
jgi:tRNA A-37 threonylcarbamoyl transferase component Bud32